MIEYLVLSLIGCALGVITGLTPGLHVNTVCLMGLGLYPRLGLDTIGFAVAMVSMSLTHTFLDFIPAIFLGVPQEETALSVLPAHQLVQKGQALKAVKLTAYGSLMGVLFSVMLLAPMTYIIPFIYFALRGIIAYVIVAAVAYLILREKELKGKMNAFLVFALSGALGMIVLNAKGVSVTYILFPVFAGLFGLSSILFSLSNQSLNIPQKPYANIKVDRGVWSSGFAGSIGGMVVGVLPAMSPSQVGIMMSGLFGSSIERFLVSVSAINTSDAIYSLVSLYSIQNPRSGVAVMLSRVMELDINLLMLFTGVFAFSSLIAYQAHMFIGRRGVKTFSKIDHRRLSYAVIGFIVVLAYVFTGCFGVLVLATATCVGTTPIFAGVSRTHLMGVLILPTLTYFLGA